MGCVESVSNKHRRKYPKGNNRRMKDDFGLAGLFLFFIVIVVAVMGFYVGQRIGKRVLA